MTQIYRNQHDNTNAGTKEHRARPAGPAARRTYSFLFRALPSLTLIAIALVSTHAAAGESASPAGRPAPVSADQWAVVISVLSVVGLATLVNLVLSIWVKLKPQPPYHDQFAPRDHTHPGLLHREEHERICQRARDEGRLDLKPIGREIAQLRGNIAALDETVRNGLIEFDRKSEDRASQLHARVNALVGSVAHIEGRLDTHINKHTGGGS